ncbi:MAG TPA: nitroreductase/quinone reductase family protein [Actinotalea sp.]|nr:nitroreductase/quinone reductase family protein [Actinotalea sp.]
MAGTFQRAMTRLHARVYRATGGRVGGRLGGLDRVLLTTRGRTSGKPRTVPLVGIRHQGTILLVGSNGGSATAPAWMRNLRVEPRVELQDRGSRRWMRARVATTQERAMLWEVVCRVNPTYRRYQQRTSRAIAVVVCEPVLP